MEALSRHLQAKGIDIKYGSEQFPAAIIKLKSSLVTFLLFSTGKFVIQGLRGFENIGGL